MGEAPATAGAAERLLAPVNPQANPQIPFAAALLSADVTATPHPGGGGHVFGQRGGAVVVFATHLATHLLSPFAGNGCELVFYGIFFDHLLAGKKKKGL